MATTPTQGDNNMTTTTWGLGSETNKQYSMEATELILYMENERGIYFSHLEPMLSAATKHYDKAQGDLNKLIKGFSRVATVGAKKYTAEYGSSVTEWNKIFTVAIREEAATYFAHYFLAEYIAGNRWGK